MNILATYSQDGSSSTIWGTSPIPEPPQLVSPPVGRRSCLQEDGPTNLTVTISADSSPGQVAAMQVAGIPFLACIRLIASCLAAREIQA